MGTVPFLPIPPPFPSLCRSPSAQGFTSKTFLPDKTASVSRRKGAAAFSPEIKLPDNFTSIRHSIRQFSTVGNGGIVPSLILAGEITWSLQVSTSSPFDSFFRNPKINFSSHLFFKNLTVPYRDYARPSSNVEISPLQMIKHTHPTLKFLL